MLVVVIFVVDRKILNIFCPPPPKKKKEKKKFGYLHATCIYIYWYWPSVLHMYILYVLNVTLLLIIIIVVFSVFRGTPNLTQLWQIMPSWERQLTTWNRRGRRLKRFVRNWRKKCLKIKDKLWKWLRRPQLLMMPGRSLFCFPDKVTDTAQ